MTDIQKAIDSNPISNGRTIIKTGNNYIKVLDTSKDTDPALESIENKYSNNFDGNKYLPSSLGITLIFNNTSTFL